MVNAVELMEFLLKPLWQRFGISTIFKDLLGLSEAQIAAVVSGCMTSCTCVSALLRECLYSRKIFFSLCCGIKEQALDVPAILEVIFHPRIAWYAWQWFPAPNWFWGKSQPSNLVWHINPGRRSGSVCAGAEYLQSQLLCVHQGALETTDPLELLQRSQGWYFVGEALCAREAAAVSDTKHPLLQSIISIYSSAPSHEFRINGEDMSTGFWQRLFPVKLIMSLNSAEIV